MSLAVGHGLHCSPALLVSLRLPQSDVQAVMAVHGDIAAHHVR